MGGVARPILGIAGAIVGGIYGGPTGAQIGFMVGSAIGGIIDGPTQIEGPRINEVPAQTSEDGRPIPIGWGIVHTTGNIIQVNPTEEVKSKEKQGKGSGTSEVTNYSYHKTFAIGVCRSIDGPITSILRIWENDKLVYDMRDNPTIPATETAAYAENITIYRGLESQLPDPELEAHWGVGNTPAFKGLSYIVWNNYDITDFAASIPAFRFEVEVNGSEFTSSRVYPIEAEDRMQIGCTVTAGEFRGPEIDYVDLDAALENVFMQQILFRHDAGEDTVDLDATISVYMGSTRTEHGPWEDVTDLDATISASMRSALVRNTMVPEKMLIGCSAPTGSMTPV